MNTVVVKNQTRDDSYMTAALKQSLREKRRLHRLAKKYPYRVNPKLVAPFNPHDIDCGPSKTTEQFHWQPVNLICMYALF